MSLAKKGKPSLFKGIKRGPLSEEHKKKISIGNKGNILSKETRKKMSLCRIGKKNPMFGRTGKRAGHYGKTHNLESRKK